MKIQTTKQAYQFAKRCAYLLDKYIDEDQPETQQKEEESEQPVQEEQQIVPQVEEKQFKNEIPRVLGHTDYKKWENFEDKEEKNTEEEEKKMGMDFAKAMCSGDHRKEIDLYEKPTSEKLQAAKRFKDEGNRFVQKGEWGKAAVEYRRALLQFDYTFPDTKEEQELFDQLKLQSHLNMCLCKLKLEEFKEAKTHAHQVLQQDPNNVKALYRRAMCYLQKDSFIKAQRDILKAVELEPNDVKLKELYENLRSKKKEYKQRNRQVAKAMFKGEQESPQPQT